MPNRKLGWREFETVAMRVALMFGRRWCLESSEYVKVRRRFSSSSGSSG